MQQNFYQDIDGKLTSCSINSGSTTCPYCQMFPDHLFMDSLGYNNNYDQFILAGSSLGFTQSKFANWGETLMDHMGIGQTLHSFREIIFIDHMGCGTYKKFYPQIKNEEDEIKYHKSHIQKATDRLAIKFPNFKFQGFLMDLNGKCTKIQVDESKKCQQQVATDKDQFLENLITHH